VKKARGIQVTDPRLVHLRQSGLEVGRALGKIPVPVTDEREDWFRKDLALLKTYECYERSELSELTEDYLKDNPFVYGLYPLQVTDWILQFYSLITKVKSTRQDWSLFFTIIEPIPRNIRVPFPILIRKLHSLNIKSEKQEILDIQKEAEEAKKPKVIKVKKIRVKRVRQREVFKVAAEMVSRGLAADVALDRATKELEEERVPASLA